MNNLKLNVIHCEYNIFELLWPVLGKSAKKKGKHRKHENLRCFVEILKPV